MAGIPTSAADHAPAQNSVVRSTPVQIGRSGGLAPFTNRSGEGGHSTLHPAHANGNPYPADSTICSIAVGRCTHPGTWIGGAMLQRVPSSASSNGRRRYSHIPRCRIRSTVMQRTRPCCPAGVTHWNMSESRCRPNRSKDRTAAKVVAAVQISPRMRQRASRRRTARVRGRFAALGGMVRGVYCAGLESGRTPGTRHLCRLAGRSRTRGRGRGGDGRVAGSGAARGGPSTRPRTTRGC